MHQGLVSGPGEEQLSAVCRRSHDLVRIPNFDDLKSGWARMGYGYERDWDFEDVDSDAEDYTAQSASQDSAV
jgi:hypothetical protein